MGRMDTGRVVGERDKGVVGGWERSLVVGSSDSCGSLKWSRTTSQLRRV